MRKKGKEAKESQPTPVKGNSMQFLGQFVSFWGVSPALRTLVICSDLLNYPDLSLSFSIR